MSEKMKAMVFKKYGSPDQLQLAEVKKPAAQADELLVKVMATAVNQADNHILSGSLRFSTGYRRPKQPILGADVAGWVEAVGSNVTQFKPGDAVFGDLSDHGRGGFGEYVAVPETAVTHKPTNLTFPQAAAVPMTAITALQGLRDKGGLQSGEHVLVNGASGGVGTFAVQIAKALGATVTAVASSRKLANARAIGADHVIDYTKEDFTQNGQQYDLIFDVVANRSVGAYRRVLLANGRYVTTAVLPALLLLGPWLALTSRQKMVNMLAKPNQADLKFVAELLQAGKITPVIDRCYPLAELPTALDYLGQGHARGKVIIQVSD